jgi:uncharacterized protein (TIGR00369 family)
MEHFRKLERMYYSAPINEYFKPKIFIEYGRAELRIPIRDEFHHTLGAIHGAVYFKALDDATFFAASSIVEDFFVLTASFHIEFLRPVVDGEIRAVATVSSEGSRRIEATGELFDSEQNLVGRGTGIFARSKVRLTPEVSYA